ncbi:MAG: sigma-70 family RNA polymerase sigma factor [Candidatus Gastranaerophilales bacterium]|nr:sigma-70 family RNA polymerase sigma factor [Candidatus Gastranaerophilales bacterium]
MANTNDDSIYIKIQEWLDLYRTSNKSNQKKRLMNLIVVAMMPVIKKIANSIARRAEDPVEDLVQAGSIGLVKAIERYKPELCPKFRIYAGYLIVGEMQHYMRDKVALIKVPREIIELAMRIKNFVKDLSDEEMDNMTSQKVAEALDVPVQKVNTAIDVDRRKKVASLDELISVDGNRATIGDLTPAYDYKEFSEHHDMKLEIDKAIKKLPAEYKEIIELFYYEDMKQTEIAQKLDLNQMMVSRKLKKAFSYMYDIIKKQDTE